MKSENNQIIQRNRKQTLFATMDAMEKDFKTTGKCDLALVKEPEYSLPWTWALARKSVYTEYINRGLLTIITMFYC